MEDLNSISSQLDKAISDMSAKKMILDDLSSKVQSASKDYEDACKLAENIHQRLNNFISGILPNISNRVRQS